MSNILNSQNVNINNPIPAKKIGEENKQSRYIEAPQSLPKYSIDKVLQEKDEFRKNIKQNQYEQLYKKKNNGILKIGVILVAIAGFFILKGKK